MYHSRRTPPVNCAAIVALALAIAAISAGKAVGQPALASESQLTGTLRQARELIRAGEYDKTIGLIDSTWALFPRDPALYAEAYLTLIKTYVFIGNDLRMQPNGQKSAELSYEKAASLIRDCLAIKQLRHVRPEPESAYPPEMLRLFTDVRARVQGGLRITSLDPPDATVILGTDTLRAAADQTEIELADLGAGRYDIQVRAKGFVTRHESLEITPGTTLDREFTLRRRHGPLWYASRVGGAGGVVIAIVMLARPKQQAESDLPTPPPPPSTSSR